MSRWKFDKFKQIKEGRVGRCEIEPDAEPSEFLSGTKSDANPDLIDWWSAMKDEIDSSATFADMYLGNFDPPEDSYLFSRSDHIQLSNATQDALKRLGLFAGMSTTNIWIDEGDTLMSLATQRALIEFFTTDIDAAKSKLRSFAMKNESNFNLNGAHQITVKNGQKYSKAPFSDGDIFSLRSAYVGKKGDPILVFSTNRGGAGQAEIKMMEAFSFLKGDVAAVIREAIGSDFIAERVKYHQAEEEKLKQRETELKLQREQEALEAKAAKYAGKVAYGAW